MTMIEEARDQLARAEQELERASRCAAERRYVSARLAAQLCAEHALKALGLALGQDGQGPGVVRLLQGLPVPVDKELLQKARLLDSVFVPTRDAEGDVHKPSCPFFGPSDSDEAIRYAGEIVEFVRSHLIRLDLQDE